MDHAEPDVDQAEPSMDHADLSVDHADLSMDYNYCERCDQDTPLRTAEQCKCTSRVSGSVSLGQ